MQKIPKQKYTAQCKALAVKRVKDGLTVGAAARELGLIDQTLRKWVKAADAGKRNGAGIVTDALTMAWFRRKPAPGVLHQYDRGSQYASHAFQGKLTEYGMTCSMSRKGNCWDNAPTESCFNSFKNERVHGWRFATREDMTATAFEYMRCFTTGSGCIRRSVTNLRHCSCGTG